MERRPSMALLGWPFGTPKLIYNMLRLAHLSITMVGLVCLPEVANELACLAGSLGDTYH